MTQGFPAPALCMITDTKPLMIHCQLSSRKAGAPTVRMQKWNSVHKLCSYLGAASINNCGAAMKRRRISLHHCNHYGNHSLKGVKESFWFQTKRSICLPNPNSICTDCSWLQISVRPRCVLKDLFQNLLFSCPPSCVMASRRHLCWAHLIACSLLQHWAPQFLHNGSNWIRKTHRRN